MAGNAFDRQIINPRERPLSSDINTAQAQLDRSMRETLAQFFRSRASGSSDVSAAPSSLFLGEGLKVRASVVPALSCRIAAGVGFQYLASDSTSGVGGIAGVDDLSFYKPLVLLNEATITGIPAGPGAGNTRIDIVEVRMNRVSGNSSSRDVLDTTTGLFAATLVNKTLAFTLDGSTGVVNDPSLSTAAISYKVGVSGGSPAEPSTTPGYVKIATIKVDTTFATLTHGNVIDQRLIAHPYGQMPFSVSCSVPSGAAAPPTNVLLSAPPGIEVVVSKIAAPSQARFTVYLIGGAFGASPRGNMQGELVHAFSATETFTLAYAGTTFGTVDSTLATALANANISSPALSFPVGTPYMAAEFYGVREQASVLDNAISDPAVVDIQGFLQRY